MSEEDFLQLDKKFKHLETYIDILDELDKARYLYYICSKLFKEPKNIEIVHLVNIGDLVQKCEIHCAKIKTLIADTKIDGIICKKCNHKLPCMRLKEHLVGVNKECPHDAIELIEETEYNNEINKINQ